MIEAYRVLLEAPASQVHRKIFNIGYENYSVSRLAEIVRAAVGDPSVTVETKPTNDLRSYHVDSQLFAATTGFKPRATIEDAVRSIVAAYRQGKFQDPLTNPLYHNIKLMQQVHLGGKTTAAR